MSQTRGRPRCGCIPGEVCCTEAAEATRRLKESVPDALRTGDWREFDAIRAWLQDHHFGKRQAGRKVS